MIDTIPPLRPAEVRVLQKRERLAPSAWAEKERVLRRGAKAGPWRNRNNPVGALVMDLCALPWVRVVVIAKGSQTGISDAVYCFLGRELDYSTGADAALVVLADEKGVKKHSKKRIIPMIEDSASLAAIKSKNPDDTSMYSITLATGTVVEIGWATSQVSLASEAYRIVILDEIGKYRSTVNIKEAEVRTATFEKCGKKVIKLGAPTDEGCPVDEALAECDVIMDIVVPCPECGVMQPMVWEQFRWPGQQSFDGETVADPRRIRRERSAWYECPHCQGRWDDYRRDLALQHGQWRPRHEMERPYAVGVHVPAWLTPFRSLSDTVAEWIEAQERPEALRAWYNNWAGLSFSGLSEEDLTSTDVLYQRRYQWWPDGAAWRVPQAACILTAAVDTQDNRLEVEVFAWGQGYECWSIARKVFPGSPSQVEVWEAADEFLQREFSHESGAALKIAAVGVDTGGHFTQEGYKFLRPRLSRRVFGVKGASDSSAPLYRISFPSKQQKRHVPLIIVGTVTAKNDIHAWMQNEEPGPGYMHFPSDYDYDYFRQLTAEKPLDQRDKYGRKKRFWVKKSSSARNEALDLRVYAYAVLCYNGPDWQRLSASLTAVPRPSGDPTPRHSPKSKNQRQQRPRRW